MKFLTLFVMSAFVSSALCFSQTDPRGWGNAHWGMTKQQLVERLGAKDVPRWRTVSVSPERESRLGLDFALNTLKFRAYFFVDEVVGLDLVELDSFFEGVYEGPDERSNDAVFENKN